jgi:hypothetical protein
MSCNEWEAGTLIIPSAQWAKFRKGLLTEWNDHQVTVLATAKKAHKAAVAAGKGKRGEKRGSAMKAAVARICGGRIGEYGDFESNHRGGHDSYDTVHGLLWKGWGANAKFQSPQKKDLPFVAISKDASLELGDASVSFNNAGRTVRWNVYENNHAVESAKGHWFAKKFWAAISRITWTRGSGGEVRGNNEYNEDEHGHQAGSYTVATYRMKTAADKKAAAARRNSYSSYGRRY